MSQANGDHTLRSAARLLGLSVLCLLALASAARGATWSAQSTQIPTAPNGDLLSVSCTATTACMAVGTNVGATGALVTLAEQWTSSAGWSLTTTPNVSTRGSLGTELNSVSCTAANACLAIGSDGSSAYFTQWSGSGTGTSWSALKKIPSPSGASSLSLDEVSCATASACTAVGSYFDSAANETVPLLEAYNGSIWSPESTASPQPAAVYSAVQSVSCRSSAFCEAVGTWENSSGVFRPLIEKWNGTAWQQQTAYQVPGVSSSYLSGVSCPVTTACVAVGYYAKNSTTGGFDERLTGSTWTAHTVTGSRHVTDVSCSAAGACTAVDRDGSGYYRLTGSTWSVQSGESGTATGISCPASTRCMAVGDHGGALFGGPATGGRSSHPPATATLTAAIYPFGESVGTTMGAIWNGSTWATEATKNSTGAERSSLSGVSCAADTCVSVGTILPPGGSVMTALSEVRTASGWSMRAMPPAGSDPVPEGISCQEMSSSAAWCMAVGTMNSASAKTTGMTATWNGSSWNDAKPMALPSGASTLRLTAVSCWAVNGCAATGVYYKASTGAGVLVSELYNGTSWVQKSVAQPSGTFPYLPSVSCVSATACRAVGYYDDSTSGAALGMAEKYNGVGWAMASLPAPSDAPASWSLSKISCTAGTACSAIGVGDTNLAYRTSGAGGAWVQQTAPDTPNTLAGLSCYSVTGCTAVTAVDSFTWTGGSAWGTTGTPFGSVASGGTAEMQDVDCTAATTCTAVGGNFRWVATPLVEQLS